MTEQEQQALEPEALLPQGGEAATVAWISAVVVLMVVALFSLLFA